MSEGEHALILKDILMEVHEAEEIYDALAVYINSSENENCCSYSDAIKTLQEIENGPSIIGDFKAFASLLREMREAMFSLVDDIASSISDDDIDTFNTIKDNLIHHKEIMDALFYEMGESDKMKYHDHIAIVTNAIMEYVSEAEDYYLNFNNRIEDEYSFGDTFSTDY